MVTIQGKERGLLTLAAMQITAGGSAGKKSAYLQLCQVKFGLVLAVPYF